MDLVIRNATLGGKAAPGDIGVDDGYISEIGYGIERDPARELDAGGGPVLPTFVEAHNHLDSAFVAEKTAAPVAFHPIEWLEATAKVKEGLSKEMVKKRARRAGESLSETWLDKSS